MAIKSVFPLGNLWPTQEPFLFCAHHLDHYPQGMPSLGPKKDLLRDRPIGQDFELRNGFRMYHGQVVPGFPAHPHRGFETITIVRRGLVDHADSLGASGRYGDGDVQWMTAGAGIQHSEMFPLINQDRKNDLELFQIWLNLPAINKMVSPEYKMFWAEQIPSYQSKSGDVVAKVIAGTYAGVKALPPPARSWAAMEHNEVTVLLVQMKSHASFSLPASKQATNRSLYFFSGSGLYSGSSELQPQTGINLDSQVDIDLKSTSITVEFLLLQAKPIGEPIEQQGPFVMNTRAEILQTFADYRRTQFGGWPWPSAEVVHSQTQGRFAKHPDGRIEQPSP